MEVNYRYVRLGAIGLALVIAAAALNPLHTVPTGHQGVITVGGNIKGIQSEG